MPMSTNERGALGGRARADSLSPERRSEISRKAYLRSLVSATVKYASEFTDEDFTVLKAVFATR
jgi:hypothetical protein